jgi:hypothetical protein
MNNSSYSGAAAGSVGSETPCKDYLNVSDEERSQVTWQIIPSLGVLSHTGKSHPQVTHGVGMKLIICFQKRMALLSSSSQYVSRHNAKCSPCLWSHKWLVLCQPQERLTALSNNTCQSASIAERLMALQFSVWASVCRLLFLWFCTCSVNVSAHGCCWGIVVILRSSVQHFCFMKGKLTSRKAKEFRCPKF